MVLTPKTSPPSPPPVYTRRIELTRKANRGQSATVHAALAAIVSCGIRQKPFFLMLSGEALPCAWGSIKVFLDKTWVAFFSFFLGSEYVVTGLPLAGLVPYCVFGNKRNYARTYLLGNSKRGSAVAAQQYVRSSPPRTLTCMHYFLFRTFCSE